LGEQSLEEIVARRAAFLAAYQNAAYARRYEALVARVAEAEAKRTPQASGLAKAVARYLFKLMAYKDEYEVARLYTDGSFQRQVAQAFEGDLRFEFHLAPPLLARKDAVTGEAKKMSYGPWMMKAFRVLAAMRGLRGTRFDIFGYSADRREERALISEYEALCGELIAGLTPANHEIALALAALPEKIRGYGHVKARHLTAVRPERERLLQLWRVPPAQLRAAE
jgi:indolepyruvate ferredoxin oxidoreductase